jgi:hypothetical protein
VRHLAAALLLTAACAPATPWTNTKCEPPARTGELPPELTESSGLAISRSLPGVLWTHNDSGHDPELFAIDSTGALLARLGVAGAHNVDWEDIARAPCPAGECLYIGDIGDNREVRDDVVVYRVPEPDLRQGSTAAAEMFRFHYPDRPRDAEALFVTDDGRVFIISKGRSDGIGVFSAPLPADGGSAPLVQVQALSDVAQQLPHQVTGAALAPGGGTVVVRTYAFLQLYSFDGQLLGEPLLPEPGLDLSPATEPQGEAVDVRADGTIFLTSEAGPSGLTAPVTRVECRF